MKIQASRLAKCQWDKTRVAIVEDNAKDQTLLENLLNRYASENKEQFSITRKKKSTKFSRFVDFFLHSENQASWEPKTPTLFSVSPSKIFYMIFLHLKILYMY